MDNGYFPMAEKITPKELQLTKDEYVIIDVREADELKEGQIDETISIPLGRLIREARHGDLNEIKRKKIYTYCSGGYRGNMAADELNKQGFNAMTIKGAILNGKNKKKKNDKGCNNK
jgi:rhodanese-related sulfurtransferase